MVLEDSSPSGFTGDTFDAFDQESSRHNSGRVDPLSAEFPHVTLWGYTGKTRDQVVRKRYQRELESAQKIIKRPITEDEAKAIAYWSNRELAILGYVLPIGVAGGSYRWYKTMDSWKFPFWKPSETFNPNVLKFPGLGQMLSGSAARIWWHTLRFGSYSAVGVLLAGFFMSSYSTSVAAVGRMQDPRYKSIIDEMKSMVKEERARLKEAMEQRRAQGRSSSGGAGVDAHTSTKLEEFDDASPTGGQSMGDYSYAQYGTESSPSQSDSTTPSSSRQRSPSPQNSQSWSQQPDITSQEKSDQSSFFGGDYDDASPTASYPPSTSTSGGIGGGSAWDRLRKNAKSSGQHTGEYSPASNSNGQGSSWEDVGRKPPKDEAQAEFDRSLERERQGGDSTNRKW
jgi:hypothetical protein